MAPPDETDGIVHDRRRALVLLGLTAAAAYSAPVLLNLHPAKAQGDGGGGGDDDGHGSGDDGSDDEGHDGDFKGSSLPPEAP